MLLNMTSTHSITARTGYVFTMQRKKVFFPVVGTYFNVKRFTCLIYLRYHGRKIGVFVPSQIVSKPSVVTPIKYIFYKSLLNKDLNFGFCFDYIDHNKQRQYFVCNYDVAEP